jgi:hypothetical protein
MSETKLYFCVGCSMRCQATECECICHTTEYQAGCKRGIQARDAELLEKVRELRMYLSDEYGWGYMSAIGNVEKLLSPKQEKKG